MNLLTGCKFGDWTALHRAPERPASHGVLWLCECQCGVHRNVLEGSLVSGRSRGCGCKTNRKYRGKSGTKVYHAWYAMISRCHKPKDARYADYGGRGITVCERWLVFDNFLADMGPSCRPGLSLDRIDNDKGYSPENCRWATTKQQQNNMRGNHRITANGETHTLVEWAGIIGCSVATIHNRLRMGWDETRAVTTPNRNHRNREAQGQGLQVIGTRVSANGDGCSLVIEDGEVAGGS